MSSKNEKTINQKIEELRQMVAWFESDDFDIEQAIERAGSKAGNKGFDCAEGAIEMINLLKEIK